MPGRPPEIGHTAESVAENVTRLRTEQNLTYTQLSDRLGFETKRVISPTAIRKIEECQRQVTVDDLVALAIALKVSPATLLMPHHRSAGTRAIATGTNTQNASGIWNWLTARLPLRGEASGKQVIEFWARSWPEWEHDEMPEELKRLKRRATKGRTVEGKK